MCHDERPIPGWWPQLKRTNQTPLSDDEVNAFLQVVLEGEPSQAWDQVTRCLEAGKSVISLAHALQIAGAELILRWQTDPAVLSLGQHVNDYSNVVNYWFRTSDNPCQPRVLYLMAAYANDVARSTPLHTSHLDEELAAHKVPDMPSDRLLRSSTPRSWRWTWLGNRASSRLLTEWR